MIHNEIQVVSLMLSVVPMQLRLTAMKHSAPDARQWTGTLFERRTLCVVLRQSAHRSAEGAVLKARTLHFELAHHILHHLRHALLGRRIGALVDAKLAVNQITRTRKGKLAPWNIS